MPASEDDNGEGTSTSTRHNTKFDDTENDTQDSLIEDATLLEEEDYLAEVNTDS